MSVSLTTAASLSPQQPQPVSASLCFVRPSRYRGFYANPALISNSDHWVCRCPWTEPLTRSHSPSHPSPAWPSVHLLCPALLLRDPGTQMRSNCQNPTLSLCWLY